MNTTITCDQIIAVGDIHGEFMAALNWIKSYDISNAAIVFCGDFGVGFYKESYYSKLFKKISKELEKRNVIWLVCRGNHSDKSYYSDRKYGNIWLLEDYSVISFESCNHTITTLFIGGACSLDRIERQEAMNKFAVQMSYYSHIPIEKARDKIQKIWWEDEVVVYDRNKLDTIYDKYKNIDTVFSHTCPFIAYPIIREPFFDKYVSINDDIVKEEQVMGKIYAYIASHWNIRQWIYGHFHLYKQQIIDDIKWTCLDMIRDNKLSVKQVI